MPLPLSSLDPLRLSLKSEEKPPPPSSVLSRLPPGLLGWTAAPGCLRTFVYLCSFGRRITHSSLTELL